MHICIKVSISSEFYLCLLLVNYFNLGRDEGCFDNMVCKFICENILAK